MNPAARPEPAPAGDLPPPQAAPSLRAERLGLQRGERPLVRGLTMSLEAGQITWLRGRNGRGKTTLLRVLAGLSSPERGQVSFGGRPLRGLPPAWRTRLRFLAHANALKEDLTVRESLRFLAALQEDPPGPEALQATLQRLGLGARADDPVRRLSQGQRRRAALVRLALPQAPSAWLLDEPFDALDDEGVVTLQGLLVEHARRGGSVLMTSHQPPGLREAGLRTLDLDAHAFATS